jgi:hypothetical protein
MGAALQLEKWQIGWLASKASALRFAIDVLGILPPGAPNPDDEPQLESWQVEALNAISTGDRLSVRAGHGVGKTMIECVIILWFMCTRYPFKIPITAYSQDQLRDVVCE